VLLAALSAAQARLPAFLVAQESDFVDPSRGPSDSGGFSVDPGVFIALLLIGFVVGVAGHVIKSKTMIAAGITMIFLATIGLPLYLAVSN